LIIKNKMSSYPPILSVLLVQLVVYTVHTALLPQLEPHLGYSVPLFWQMLSQGIAAAAISYAFRFSYWWVLIQLTAPPLLVLGLALNLPLWGFPVILLLLLLVFWNVAVNRVPLYLTNRKTSEKLVSLLPKKGGITVADLGSGFAGTLREMAVQKPDQNFVGFETAPIPFLVSWTLTKLGPSRNVNIRFKSFWSVDLGEFDVLYCFLSPVPMAQIYQKAAQEMKPGGMFISNSFKVPGHKADRVVTVKDGRKTKLMIWKI